MSAYKLKPITFLGRETLILLQNANGPCPLLAIANVLLLRNRINIPPQYTEVSHHYLVEMIANYMLEVNPPLANEELRADQQQTLNDAIAILPKLQIGLDVNVKFRSSTDFEYTPECSVFDMLGIRLLHGWVIDPQDKAINEAINHLSYNQLVEKVISCQDAVENKIKAESAIKSPTNTTRVSEVSEVTDSTDHEPADNGSTTAQQTSSTENDDTQLTSQLASQLIVTSDTTTSTVDADAALLNVTSQTEATETTERTETEKPNGSDSTAPENVKKDISTDGGSCQVDLTQGRYIENFLTETASQLTYFGLLELHREVNERELCVFFRNNHFSTVFKIHGELYLLATDVGFAQEPDIVWEKLDEIDGDVDFVNSEFQVYGQPIRTVPFSTAAISNSTSKYSTVSDHITAGSKNTSTTHSEQADYDFALALQLQAAETVADENGSQRSSQTVIRQPPVANRVNKKKQQPKNAIGHANDPKARYRNTADVLSQLHNDRQTRNMNNSQHTSYNNPQYDPHYDPQSNEVSSYDRSMKEEYVRARRPRKRDNCSIQ
eukprot:GILK01005592.1.p1 GENE.GILK01005592.1~~GILK01005592.1.p1  ORF type:complete len:564 (-),score=122.28 GILK01005592.1:478-2130(-)